MQGPQAPLTIRRDAFGVAHVQAASEHDAWFGQGFASAQDRLWQMEYDRRRGPQGRGGRWAEAAGRAALAGDTLGPKGRGGSSSAAQLAGQSRGPPGWTST